MEKKLTPGTWIFLGNLSPATTDEELAHYFQQCGIAIAPEAVSTRDSRNPNYGRTAMVSVPGEVVATLVEWAIDNRPVRNTGNPQEDRVPRIAPVGRRFKP